MKLLTALVLVFGFKTATAADLNCSDLIGSWSGERNDLTLLSNRRTIKALKPDGSYWIKFIHDNGEEVTIQEEHGTWTCKENVLGIHINQIDDRSVSFSNKYRLLDLNGLFHSIKPIDPNCASVIGDCSEDILLEYFRVLN